MYAKLDRLEVLTNEQIDELLEMLEGKRKALLEGPGWAKPPLPCDIPLTGYNGVRVPGGIRDEAVGHTATPATASDDASGRMCRCGRG